MLPRESPHQTLRFVFHNILTRSNDSAPSPRQPARNAVSLVTRHRIAVAFEGELEHCPSHPLQFNELLTGRSGDSGESETQRSDLRRSQRVRLQLVQISPTRLRGTKFAYLAESAMEDVGWFANFAVRICMLGQDACKL